jgi:hypothetical protein
MNPTPVTYTRYLEILNELHRKGWEPASEKDMHYHKMVFRKNGKLYDLSAADLSKLDEIEEKGHFLLQP